MKQYDIAFLCQYFYPEYVSSATLPFDTAEYLSNNGFKVKALCGYPKEYLNNDEQIPKSDTVSGIDIQRLRYLQLKRSGKLGRIVNFVSFFFSALLQVRRLRHCRSVIVYSNPPMIPLVALLAKKLYGTQLMYVCYDIYPELAIRSGSTMEHGLMSRVMHWINRKVYPRVDLVVTLSNDMKRFIEENRSLNCQVAVIPNWYDDVYEQTVVSFNDENTVAQEDKVFTVSYLGNMGVVQDVETILDAAVLMSDRANVKFLFAGHGSKEEWLKCEAEKLGLGNIEFLGFLHGDKYQQVLNKSDCCLVSLIPGVTDFCSPSKVYAYLMTGKPVVAIMDKCSLSNELDESGAGFHVPNNDAKGLVDKLTYLLENPTVPFMFGLAARTLYERKYTKAICLSQYNSVVGNLLEEKS